MHQGVRSLPVAPRIPESQIAATTLLLSSGIANVGFWTAWEAVGYHATMLAIAVTAIMGVVSILVARSGRWYFVIITVSATAILYFSLVDADAGEANEYLGVISSAVLLPIISIAAVVALISTSLRARARNDQ